MLLRSFLMFFGMFDIVFALTFLSGTVIFTATCTAEDVSFITTTTTVEQWQFFYKAMESCNYENENSVPSTGIICKQLEIRVLPFLIISTSLNFLFGVFILIIARDKHFLLDDKKGKRKEDHQRVHSLGFVAIGILFEMCFTLIGLLQYSDPRFCWLTVSISESTYTSTRQVIIIIEIVMLSLYKPSELIVYYLYVCKLIIECDKVSKSSSATCNLAAQLESKQDIKKTPTPPERVTIDETGTVPELSYNSEEDSSKT